MEILGTPSDEFMQKITSESVSKIELVVLGISFINVIVRRREATLNPYHLYRKRIFVSTSWGRIHLLSTYYH